MDRIHVILTKRPYNLGSLLIRYANPVSFVKIAPASHSIVVDGTTGYGIEASFGHGVRRAPLKELLKGLTVVTQKRFEVPNAEAGLSWGRDAAERRMKYDLKGALALGLAPNRDWQDDSNWFCFELCANVLAKAGRKPFVNSARVTAYMLMSLPDALVQSEKTTVVSP